MPIHIVYSKIRAILRLFVEPLTNTNGDSLDDENIRLLDEFVLKLSGSDLQKHLHDCAEHSLLTEQQIKEAKTVMFNYIYEVSKSLYERFPEMTNCTSFLDPTIRQLQEVNISALVERFHTGKDPFNFDASVVRSQYIMYQNDSCIDIMFQVAGKDYAKFWYTLYEGEDLAKLALLLLSISPNSVICERGFSTMNYIKNEFRSVLTQEHLNACMSIALCDYTIETFPFERCL